MLERSSVESVRFVAKYMVTVIYDMILHSKRQDMHKVGITILLLFTRFLSLSALLSLIVFLLLIFVTAVIIVVMVVVVIIVAVAISIVNANACFSPLYFGGVSKNKDS